MAKFLIRILFKILLENTGNELVHFEPEAWNESTIRTPYEIFKQRMQEELISQGWVELYEMEELDEDMEQTYFAYALKLNNQNIQVINIPYPQEGSDIKSSLYNKFKRYGEDTRWNWGEFLKFRKLTELFHPEQYTHSELQEYLVEIGKVKGIEMVLPF